MGRCVIPTESSVLWAAVLFLREIVVLWGAVLFLRGTVLYCGVLCYSYGEVVLWGAVLFLRGTVLYCGPLCYSYGAQCCIIFLELLRILQFFITKSKRKINQNLRRNNRLTWNHKIVYHGYQFSSN